MQNNRAVLNLKEQFRYLVEHGVSDHGNTIGEACDKAYEIMLPKLVALCSVMQPFRGDNDDR